MTVEFKRAATPVRQSRLAFNARLLRGEPDGPRELPRRAAGIRTNDDTPPVAIPPGHVGPVVLPGTGRLVYWTGRVAIGLRHQPERSHDEPVPESALWVQDLMLGPGHTMS